MRMLRSLLAELCFKDVLGTTEIVGGREYPVVLGKAPCVWETNRNVMVVLDERRHPWVRRGNDIPSILRLPLDDRADRGAYVPHSSDRSERFWHEVFPGLPTCSYPSWEAAVTVLEGEEHKKRDEEIQLAEKASQLRSFLDSEEGQTGLRLLKLCKAHPGPRRDSGIDLVIGLWEATGFHNYHMDSNGIFWKTPQDGHGNSLRVDPRAIVKVCRDPIATIRAGLDKIAREINP